MHVFAGIVYSGRYSLRRASGGADNEASDLIDEELLRKARITLNGAKSDHPWNSNMAENDSHSETDMALCCLLAFWTGGDRSWMNQLVV
uniref:phage NrS-1 polymerase family protein n=1 Tax=Halegenticoccus tardaugens TaxID=2071624 RepID=UPI0037426000